MSMNQTEDLKKLVEGILKLSLPNQYYIAGLVEEILQKGQLESQGKVIHGETGNAIGLRE